MAQLGFSAHATNSADQFLFGSPGVAEWKGSVFLNRLTRRRSTSSRNKRSNNYENIITSYNPLYAQLDTFKENDTYFGYATTSGNFDSKNKDHIYYVTSGPRSNSFLGEVIIFDYTSNSESINMHNQTIKIYKKFKGHQTGEYFGYSLVADDFNGDGVIDLVVSAPFYKSSKYNSGRVYVFLNDGDWKFTKKAILQPDEKDVVNHFQNHPQFGVALGKLGDINRDGYAGNILL